MPIDYSRWADITARSSQATAAAISGVADKFADIAEKRKQDKDTIKAAEAKGKAVKELFGDQGGFLDSFLAGLGDEELPISERAAMASGMNDLIAAGIDKFNTERDFGLKERALNENVRQFDATLQSDNYTAQTKQQFDETAKLNEAATRFIAAKDAEKNYKGGKLPDLTASDSMIDSLLQQGNGTAALSMVEAREDQVAKFLQNNGGEKDGKKLANIAVPGGTLDVFVDNASGVITDLYGNPLNTEATMPEQFLPDAPGVLPARPDAADVPPGTVVPNRVPPRPQIGFKPATPATQRTPEQIRKDELEIKKLEGDLMKQEADVDIAQRANAAAVSKASEALAALKATRNHPGRWAATGKTSYLPSIRGSDAFEFEQKLEQAKALAGTIGIEAMRGLGAMSEKEFEAAKASIAQLEMGQKTETIEKELDSLIRLFEAKIGKTEADAAAQSESAQDRLNKRRQGK